MSTKTPTTKDHCCQSGCEDCKFGYNEKVDPSIPAELLPKKESEEPEIYDGDIPEDQDL